MRSHLRYLWYVVLHKTYVFLNGMSIMFARQRYHAQYRSPFAVLAWMWRLLVHDLSKFRPSEWTPYVETFYGPTTADVVLRRLGRTMAVDEDREFLVLLNEEKQQRRARFNGAWLLHQHRNAHHWQHWLLQEDDGKRLVLLPPAVIADEMVADWLSAGTKILQRPSLAKCVEETIVWYTRNKDVIQLREAARLRVEQNLVMLADHVGLRDAAYAVQAAQAARVSITIPGR